MSTTPSGLLFAACNGTVVAIRPETGEEAWRTRLKTGALTATARQDACILEHDGRVYVGCYGHLFALAATTGEILWHNELRGLGYNDVTLAIGGHSIQFVSRVVHQ
jgi:outer membrane protein assembly factor BamB